MTVKIFIGNLSSDTVTEDLQPMFERYGTVTECAVLRNFGFVHMEDEGEATTAIKELTGTLIKGSRMRVEMSTGKSLRGEGGGKVGGRGRGRGRGDFRGMGRDRFSGPPRGRHPYAREPYPYDYYDRPYPPPPPHPAERSRAPPPDDRRYPYPEDRLRLPPHPEDRYSDPRDRYPPPPPSRYDRYEERYYDRYPPAAPSDDPYSRDPYERPPQDYYSRYRAYDGYADPVRRPAPEEPPRYSAPEGRGRPEANGYEYDVADYRKGAAAPQPQAPAASAPASDSAYSSYYYDRFYNKQSNGSGGGAMGNSGGYPASTANQGQYQPKAAQMSMKKERQPDQQSLLQTGPIYF